MAFLHFVCVNLEVLVGSPCKATHKPPGTWGSGGKSDLEMAWKLSLNDLFTTQVDIQVLAA